jgi:hypothetical protein
VRDRFELSRADARSEQQAGREERRTDLERRLGGAAYQATIEANDRERLAARREEFERGQATTERGWQQEDIQRALGEQAKAREEQTRREAVTAGAESVRDLDLGVTPDDPAVETGWRGGWQNPDADLRPLVERLSVAFGAPTTPGEVDQIEAALADKVRERFAREIEAQVREGGRPFAVNNAEEQAALRDMLLVELARMAAGHRARVAEAPGPQAPNAPRGYTRPPR